MSKNDKEKKAYDEGPELLFDVADKQRKAKQAAEAKSEETKAPEAAETKQPEPPQPEEAPQQAAEADPKQIEEAVNAAVKDQEDKYMRLLAEYDNYRKRSTREADQKFGDGVSHAVEKIIPILDTLDMAANAPTIDENYKKGVVMTLDKAAKALEALHVEEIEVLGKPFDPNFMNAVQQIPAPDGQESGTVVTVFQKGYKLGDKIIRHATVVVAE